MKIIIPTLNRVSSQPTLAAIPTATLLVHPEEFDAYRAAYPMAYIDVIPNEIRGIAAIREYIVRTYSGGEKVLSLDDDLSFYTRSPAHPGRLLDSTPEDIREMLLHVENALDDYAHVSIAPREGYPMYSLGKDKEPVEFVENVRYIRAIAVNPALVPDDVDFQRCKVMEDFDVALQLLRAGRPSIVLCNWAQGQRQTQADGGCSEYRTHENHAAAAHKLAELHPGFVRLRQKKNKTGGEFGERTEVTIYWKKAFASSGVAS